ncbi:hypothetical protein E4U19_001978 [Claviceps sp. Clav32 group G5]|nr:hypothetical protein E4U19_001978 [Claviceps sp. Clav32 group G5]
MSDDFERLYSSARIRLTDRRSRLKIDSIEACECLRHWLGVADKDESYLRDAEAEVLQGYQDFDILGNNEEHRGLLDGPEFDQKIEHDE